MYHAMVRIMGVWVTFGLHVPSSQWSNVFQTLKRAYGQENVTYLFWKVDEPVDDVAAVQARAESQIHFANLAQREWEAGRLALAAGEDGTLHLSRGISLLCQPAH